MEEYKPNLKSELLWIAFVLISLGGFYFLIAEEKILVYRPGEWLKEFEKLYNRAEQEKTRRKIEDLKKRYNLN